MASCFSNSAGKKYPNDFGVLIESGSPEVGKSGSEDDDLLMS